MFTEPYMRRALLAGLLLAPQCALLGVFVTARGMAFFGDTISHAALAGVALGYWIGLADPTLPMVGVGLAVSLALIWLREHTQLLTDTIMALLLSGSVAVGILVLSLLRTSRGDIHRFLFGDILAIGPLELWLGAAVFVVVVGGVLTCLSDLALLTVQEDLAHVRGVAVRRLNYAFVLVLTITIAVSIRLLGIILVTSLLVIPPAAARGVARNLRQHIVGSVLVGVIGGVGGIVLSYQLDVPCGPTIVLVCIALFVLSLTVRRGASPA